MSQNTGGVTANPISLIFPRSASSDELVAILRDVEQFFKKWPSMPEIYVPFLPDRKQFPLQWKALHLLNNAGLGYGAAVKEALKKTRTDFSFVLDVPLEYPLADVFKAWMEFESHPETDIIVGSRRLPESSRLREPPRWYWKVDSWLNDRLHQRTGINVHDLTTSFYGFRNSKVRSLAEDVRDVSYCFAPRLIQLAQKSRFGITEHPAHWNPNPREIWNRFPGDQWNLLKMSFL
jgi:hypothetical protein